MPDFSVESNQKQFQKTFNDYLSWVKKQPSSIVNQKLYFVALQAMNKTKAVTKQEITNELNQPSEKYPDIRLGELLVLRDLRDRGKMPKRGKTLTKNMPGYVQRLINKRVSHIQFLRSGWLPAIKKLDYWNRKDDVTSQTFSKKFAPKKPAGVRQFGVEKGNVRPAQPSQYGSNCRGTIFNFIGQGKQDSPTVNSVLQDGLNKAVQEEIRSMKQYMEKKFTEEMRRRAARGEFRLT